MMVSVSGLNRSLAAVLFLGVLAVSILGPVSTSAAQPPGYLGIRFAGVSNVLTRILGHDWRYGAKITAVQAGSPAARAGLKPGDIIVEANRRILGGPKALRRFVFDHAENAGIFGFVRDGDFHERRVRLGTAVHDVVPLRMATDRFADAAAEKDDAI